MADTPSSLAVHALDNLGFQVPPPRSYSSAGVLGFPLDGNLIGGALLGAGMSLAASCPGMVFTQVAMGVPSAQTTLAGAVAGGMFWSALLRPWVADRLRRQASSSASFSSSRGSSSKKAAGTCGPRTLAQLFGTGRAATFVLYEVLLAAVVVTVAGRMPSAPSALQPIAGGLAIGAAQLLSLLARGSLVGVSTCYEHAGDWVLYLLGAGGNKVTRPPTGTLVFSASMMAGALALARERPDLAVAPGALTMYVAP